MLDMILSLHLGNYKHRFYFQTNPVNFEALAQKDAAWRQILSHTLMEAPTVEDMEKVAPVGDRLLEEMGLTVKV